MTATWTIELPGATVALRFTPADPDTHAELLHSWFAQPHVQPWWGGERSLPDTHAYLVRQCGLAHLVPWIVSAGGTPFAYVETYRAAEDPLAQYFPLVPSDRGWHVLVGPADVLGKGLPRLLGRAVLAWLLAEPSVERVVCEPNERNARMVGFCAALGYQVLASLDLPDKRALLLTYERETFAERWPGDLSAGAASRAAAAVEIQAEIPTETPSESQGGTEDLHLASSPTDADVAGPDRPADADPATGLHQPADDHAAPSPGRAADADAATGPGQSGDAGRAPLPRGATDPIPVANAEGLTP